MPQSDHLSLYHFRQVYLPFLDKQIPRTYIVTSVCNRAPSTVKRLLETTMATSTESNCIPLALFVSFPHVFLFLRPFPCPRKRHEPVRAAKRDDVVPSELSSLTLSVILRSVHPFPSPFTLPRFPSPNPPRSSEAAFFFSLVSSSQDIGCRDSLDCHQDFAQTCPYHLLLLFSIYSSPAT